MLPKTARRFRKKFQTGGGQMVEIQNPKIEEILQALQSEEPTDREIWILTKYGAGFR